jgi:competence protein ComEC
MRNQRTMLTCLVLVLLLAGLVFGENPIRVFVNGRDLGSNIKAHIVDGEVLVPLQSVADALGVEVHWDPDASCIHIVSDTVKDGKSTSPPAEKKQITVYITKSGRKYHRSSCRYLGKSCMPISLEDAKSRGYSPCSVCKPPS